MNDNFWADKFIKRETIPADELAKRFNIRNPRTHPESQRDATETSLDRLGWIDEVSLSTNGNGPASLADNPDAVLFDGHERVELALMRGPDTPVPTNWYQLTPEQTQEALLTKDLTTQMAEIDIPALTDLRFDMPDFDNEAFDEFLTSEFDFDFGGDGNRGGGDTEPQVDRAGELQEIWQVAPGDVWECGPHRVICGDCRKPETWQRLLDGQKTNGMFTSPPYAEQRKRQYGGVPADEYIKWWEAV